MLTFSGKKIIFAFFEALHPCTTSCNYGNECKQTKREFNFKKILEV